MKKKKLQSINPPLFHEVWQLFRYMGRHRQLQFCFLLLMMLASSVTEMVSLGTLFPFLESLENPQPFLSHPQWQSLLRMAQADSSIEVVRVFALVFISSVIIANGLRFLAMNAQVKFAASSGGDISCQVYEKILRQSYSFHIQNNSSSLMQTVIEDTNRLTFNVLIPLLTMLSDGLLAVGLILSLVILHGKVLVIAFLFLGFIYVLIYQFRKNILNQNSQLIARNGQDRIKIVQESLGGIREILLSNNQSFFQQTYQGCDRTFRKTQAENYLKAQLPRYAVEAIVMSSIAILAAILGTNGNFSQIIPILGTLALGAKRLLPCLQSVFFSLAMVQGTRESLSRVLLALKRPIKSSDSSLFSLEPMLLEKGLEVKNVWYHYIEDKRWVVQDMNLRIKAKTTVGFIGATGSGKSTTADLLLGLLRPQKGTITVDGKVLEGDCLQRWQQSIAHVPQSIFLTDATIEENIAFAVSSDEICFEQVKAAAQLAQIDSFIEQLPAGYKTYVGERGVKLSGGQKQRIGIARALYQKASVIIFDEATSALDNETEKEVMDAIHALSEQLTLILIAHRLSTVKKCDQIFVFDQGRVVSKGKYQEVVNYAEITR